MAAKKKIDAARPDVAALRAMSAEELRGKLTEQRQEMMHARFQARHGAARKDFRA